MRGKKEIPYSLLERRRTRGIYRERDGNTRTETDTQRKIAREVDLMLPSQYRNILFEGLKRERKKEKSERVKA